jgi:succinyl-diaminopimelate desuccinylase
MEKYIEENKNELIEIVQEILKIKSVEEPPEDDAPFGIGVKLALEYALDVGEEMGFKVKNFDNYAGYVEYGEGDGLISILGHLDVVPEGKGWHHPPYGGEIKDGKIFGRGATDDKGPMMAALFGMYALKETGLPIKKRVRIVFGTNEETGWKGITYYKQKEKEPLIGFTPDGNFPVINREKGILNVTVGRDFETENDELLLKGGERPNMVPDYAEAELLKSVDVKEFDGVKVSGNKAIAKGISAHGAHPWEGKNAVTILCSALKEASLREDVKNVIGFVNECVDGDVYGEKLGIAKEDELSGKLTCNLGVMYIGKNSAEVTFNIRYPITDKMERIVNNIKVAAEKYGLKVRNTHHQPPLFVDESEDIVQKLLKVYEEETGEKGYTLAIGGGTYARAMDKGVAFGPVFPGMVAVEHQPDEFIGVNHLIRLAKIYGKAIYALAKD